MPDEQPQQMSVAEFGATIKAQYPQYADHSDEDVGAAMLEKYPVYKSRIRETPPAPNLEGVKPGEGRTFREGPFAGQTWALTTDSKPYRVLSPSERRGFDPTSHRVDSAIFDIRPKPVAEGSQPAPGALHFSVDPEDLLIGGLAARSVIGATKMGGLVSGLRESVAQAAPHMKLALAYEVMDAIGVPPKWRRAILIGAGILAAKKGGAAEEIPTGRSTSTPLGPSRAPMPGPAPVLEEPIGRSVSTPLGPSRAPMPGPAPVIEEPLGRSVTTPLGPSRAPMPGPAPVIEEPVGRSISTPLGPNRAPMPGPAPVIEEPVGRSISTPLGPNRAPMPGPAPVIEEPVGRSISTPLGPSRAPMPGPAPAPNAVSEFLDRPAAPTAAAPATAPTPASTTPNRIGDFVERPPVAAAPATTPPLTVKETRFVTALEQRAGATHEQALAELARIRAQGISIDTAQRHLMDLLNSPAMRQAVGKK